MKRFLFAFFIFLVWFLAGSWVYTCVLKGLCTAIEEESSRTGQSETRSSIPVEIVNTSYAEEKATVVAEDTTIGEEPDTLVRHKVIYFNFDSEKQKSDAALKEYITALTAYIDRNPSRTISITGHTDNMGEPDANRWVGMQRAKSAMKYLVSQGISEERIRVYSRGENNPIAPNTTKDGRKRNRRVEITIN